MSKTHAPPSKLLIPPLIKTCSTKTLCIFSPLSFLFLFIYVHWSVDVSTWRIERNSTLKTKIKFKYIYITAENQNRSLSFPSAFFLLFFCLNQNIYRQQQWLIPSGQRPKKITKIPKSPKVQENNNQISASSQKRSSFQSKIPIKQ